MFASLSVVMLGLCCCSGESSQLQLGRPQLFGPSEALLKSVVEFQCAVQTYPKNETILLQLFKEGNRDKLLGFYTSLAGEVANFPLVIKRYHEGNLECVAKAQNNSDIEPTVSDTHYLKVIEPVKRAAIVIMSGQEEFFEEGTLELRCKLAAGNYVSYKWLLNDQLVSPSSSHYVEGDRVSIPRTTSEDSGSYKCVATNSFNKTNFNAISSEVQITVKDKVSNPDISMTVLKEDSHTYSALVTCHSTKGTPPIIFSLYNMERLLSNTTSEERNAMFKIPLVLDRPLGFLQCQANNGDQTTYSDWIPLEVVPVGGPVTMDYSYNVGENYAVFSLTLHCKLTKGSFPRYQWFLNKTHLHGQGSFYYVVDQLPEQSILILAAGWWSAGTYHCEVSDSFDNSTVISSKRMYLDNDVLNRLPDFVVAVVFGCFTVLILLVSICCGIGVVFRKRQYGEKFLLSLEMEGMVDAYEDELGAPVYSEDANVAKAARGDEFDQASEASVDEWPQIEEERKTMEDEAVEEP